MSDAAAVRRQFGDGPLSRAAARIYTLLVVGLLLLLTVLPGLVGLMLLDRDVSNLPLVALCLLPVGPAVSAALYALRHQPPDVTELRPVATFWRGYRVNLPGVLWIWAPTLLWLTIIAVNVAHRAVAAVPAWWLVPLVAVGVGVTLCAANALMIVSLFTFRTRDAVRLALHFLVRTPGVTVGTAVLLAAAVAVTAVLSEAVLALFGVLVVLAWSRIGDPMIDLIGKEFTA